MHVFWRAEYFQWFTINTLAHLTQDQSSNGRLHNQVPSADLYLTFNVIDMKHQPRHISFIFIKCSNAQLDSLHFEIQIQFHLVGNACIERRPRAKSKQFPSISRLHYKIYSKNPHTRTTSCKNIQGTIFTKLFSSNNSTVS